MNNKTIIIAVVAIIIVGGGVLIKSNQQKSATSIETPTTQPAQNQNPTPAAGNEATGAMQMEGTPGGNTASTTGASIETVNFAFTPSTLRVKAGETIKFTNRDNVAHSFTSDDGTSFDTGLIGQNKSAAVTAPSKPGTYSFHCTPHAAKMKGTLIVE